MFVTLMAYTLKYEYLYFFNKHYWEYLYKKEEI